MKIRVGHSESILVAEGHWVKDVIDVEINTEVDGQFPEYPDFKASLENNSQILHDQLKEIVKKWHSMENKPTINPNWDHNAPLPETTIDRPLSNTIDALVKDIESCKDITTIDSYRILVKSKPELQPAFEKRRAELVKLESQSIINAVNAYIKQ